MIEKEVFETLAKLMSLCKMERDEFHDKGYLSKKRYRDLLNREILEQYEYLTSAIFKESQKKNYRNLFPICYFSFCFFRTSGTFLVYPVAVPGINPQEAGQILHCDPSEVSDDPQGSYEKLVDYNVEALKKMMDRVIPPQFRQKLSRPLRLLLDFVVRGYKKDFDTFWSCPVPHENLRYLRYLMDIQQEQEQAQWKLMSSVEIVNLHETLEKDLTQNEMTLLFGQNLPVVDGVELPFPLQQFCFTMVGRNENAQRELLDHWNRFYYEGGGMNIPLWTQSFQVMKEFYDGWGNMASGEKEDVSENELVYCYEVYHRHEASTHFQSYLRCESMKTAIFVHSFLEIQLFITLRNQKIELEEQNKKEKELQELLQQEEKERLEIMNTFSHASSHKAMECSAGLREMTSTLATSLENPSESLLYCTMADSFHRQSMLEKDMSWLHKKYATPPDTWGILFREGIVSPQESAYSMEILVELVVQQLLFHLFTQRHRNPRQTHEIFGQEFPKLRELYLRESLASQDQFFSHIQWFATHIYPMTVEVSGKWEDVRFSIDGFTSLQMTELVQTLLYNAINYGKKDKSGELEVKCISTDEGYQIRVINAKGENDPFLPPDKQGLEGVKFTVESLHCSENKVLILDSPSHFTVSLMMAKSLFEDVEE